MTETVTKQKFTGLRLLKWVLIIAGIVALAFCIYFLVRTAFDMRQVMGYANSNKSQEVTSPMPLFYWAVGLAGGGGLLLGLGLGMPRRTARAIKSGVPLSRQVTHDDRQDGRRRDDVAPASGRGRRDREREESPNALYDAELTQPTDGEK